MADPKYSGYVGQDVYAEGGEARKELNAGEEAQKRFMYEKMSPRRRKFVDRIGYENWDPFQAPKEPLDVRKESTGRTGHELVRDFMKSRARQSGRLDRAASPDPRGQEAEAAYAQGVLECAISMVKGDEKFRGIYDFCLWYSEQIKDENF